MDWPEVLKTGGAFVGTVLGLWNLLAPRWTGVKVDRSVNDVRITNTGARPVYVAFVGFIETAAWELERAVIVHRMGDDQHGPTYAVDPWRSISLPLELRTTLQAKLANSQANIYWLVRLETGVFFTTIPWYRLIAHWRVRRAARAQIEGNPFME